MDRVYAWLDAIVNGAYGFSDFMQEYISSKLRDRMCDEHIKRLKNNGEPFDTTSPEKIEQKWIDWQIYRGGYGKEHTNKYIIRIIDVEFLKYDHSTRVSITCRILSHLYPFVHDDTYDPGKEIILDPDYDGTYRFLCDNAWDEYMFFIGDLQELCSDFDIDIIELVDDDAKNRLLRVLGLYGELKESKESPNLHVYIKGAGDDKIIEYIKKEYATQKGRAIAELMFALQQMGMLGLRNRAGFYRALLKDTGRDYGDTDLKSFREGVDKYIRMGVMSEKESGINQEDILRVLEILKSCI